MNIDRGRFLNSVHDALVTLHGGENFIGFWYDAFSESVSIDKRLERMLMTVRQRKKAYAIWLPPDEYRAFQNKKTSYLRLRVQTTMPFFNREEMRRMGEEVEQAFKKMCLTAEWSGNPAEYIFVYYG